LAVTNKLPVSAAPPQRPPAALNSKNNAPVAAPPPPPSNRGGNQQQVPSRPVTTQIKIDVTPNKQVGKPAGVKAAEADKVAALAALAAEQRREDAAIRDAYSQNLMAAQSSAADMYGGRAPAILGQGVTGARRRYVSGRSTMVQENVAERAALQRAYNEAIRQAYAAAAQQALDNARANAQTVAMVSQTMGY
jgi:hypothetical protein